MTGNAKELKSCDKICHGTARTRAAMEMLGFEKQRKGFALQCIATEKNGKEMKRKT